MLAILKKYEPSVSVLAASGEAPFVATAARASGSRRR